MLRCLMGTNCVCNTNPAKSVKLPAISDSNFNYYVKAISKFPQLDAKEELSLAKLAKGGCFEAKEKLIQANLKLVITIAKKIVHTSNLPMIDLVQEGNLGLMVAVEKFNYKLGYRFGTYASWWIKQAIFKAISEQSHSMKIPVYIQETLSKFSKIKAEMEQKAHNAIKNEDVAKKMNIDTTKIDSYLNAYSKTLSLEADYEMNGHGDICLSEIIEDKRVSVQNEVEYEALRTDIYSLLDTLKEREQNVIKLRFGLGNLKKQTLEEIGKIYGVTKECIRQTEARALRKLRGTDFSATLFAAYVI